MWHRWNWCRRTRSTLSLLEQSWASRCQCKNPYATQKLANILYKVSSIKSFTRSFKCGWGNLQIFLKIVLFIGTFLVDVFLQVKNRTEPSLLALSPWPPKPQWRLRSSLAQRCFGIFRSQCLNNKCLPIPNIFIRGFPCMFLFDNILTAATLWCPSIM